MIHIENNEYFGYCFLFVSDLTVFFQIVCNMFAISYSFAYLRMIKKVQNEYIVRQYNPNARNVFRSDCYRRRIGKLPSFSWTQNQDYHHIEYV